MIEPLPTYPAGGLNAGVTARLVLVQVRRVMMGMVVTAYPVPHHLHITLLYDACWQLSKALHSTRNCENGQFRLVLNLRFK